MIYEESLDTYLNIYEKWFDEHYFIYQSEIEAVKHFIPFGKKGIEIGVGTGRFSLPLNIAEGVEAFENKIEFARRKGLKVYRGIAESLPLPSSSYDFALLITTECFIANLFFSFWEVKRILKHNGNFIFGFVDKGSGLNESYRKIKGHTNFYSSASFYSTGEIIRSLKKSEFYIVEIIQTIFGDIQSINNVQSYKPGYGEGRFVVIKSLKE
jgi:SAM-dependent methyltransferase